MRLVWLPRRTFLASIAIGLIASCAPKIPPQNYIPGLTGAAEIYTQTNLHPDGSRVLHSLNYQRGDLLPVCTRVTIDKLNSDFVSFTDVGTRQSYRYHRHPRDTDSIGANLAKYFGPSCPRDQIDRLSDIDRRGIKTGTVEVGMTRQGVIFAIGYPPPATTPNLESRVWRYWRNRFRSFNVEFGVTGKVIDPGFQRVAE